MLLLHGGLGSSNYWGHQIEELAKKFRVIAMDTRGHGRSPLTSRSFHYALFASDAVALLDFLSIGAASIIGWSDGAITGLYLAIINPERVTRLFAFGANATLDGLKPGGAKSPVFGSYVARCKVEYAALSPQPTKWPELVSDLSMMWRSEPNYSKQQLEGIRVPVTVSGGEYDEIIKRNHTERLAHTIPRARLAILPGVSHFGMLQNPAQFNAALNGFLAI